MPAAVASTEPTRFELKSLPEGFVVIREMTYGERLQRQSLTGAMKVLKDNKSDFAGELAMQTDQISRWDFANLVMDHNLEDTDGRKLNLSMAGDLNKLSSKIGDEVGKYIDQINSFDDEGN